MYFKIKDRHMTDTKTVYFFTLSTLLLWHDIYIPSISTSYHVRNAMMSILYFVVFMYIYTHTFTSINFNLQPNILIFTHI